MATRDAGAVATREMSPEQFEQSRQKELDRRNEFRKAFPTVASAIDSTIIKQLPSDVSPEAVIKTGGVDEQSEEKINEVNKVHRTMAEVGTIPVTIVNINPWEVIGAGRWLMYKTIPACPIGQPYARYVIDRYEVDIEDKGGRFGASPLTPVTIGRDLMSQMTPLKRGGLFMYMGDHNPGEYHLEFHCPACNAKRTQACREDGVVCQPHPARPHADDYHKEMKLWEAAKKEQRIFMQRLYRYAEQEAMHPNRAGFKNLTTHHYLAAEWLHHYRYLKEMPKWTTETRSDENLPEKCWNCTAELIGDPCQCLNCGVIVNPAKAYEKGEIEEDHHALRRLTREQLDKLGLEHIPTLAEWRAKLREGAPETGTVAGITRKSSFIFPAKGAKPGNKKAVTTSAQGKESDIDPLADIPEEDPAAKGKK